MLVTLNYRKFVSPLNSIEVINEDGDKIAPAKGRVESALRKEIRTAQQQFYRLLDLQNGQSTHFSLESILNKDKNRVTVSVGGFWQIDAPSRICSEPHPSQKSGEIGHKRIIFS